MLIASGILVPRTLVGIILILSATGFTFRAPAVAGEPVAIVEDVATSNSKIMVMDYLETGQVVELGANGRITLGYLQSCALERITGGTVTIGVQQSVVKGGKIIRRRVRCAGGAHNLAKAQKRKGAVAVFRGRRRTKVTVYNQYPYFRVPRGGAILKIESIKGNKFRRLLLVEGNSVDFAAKGIRLTSGGVYRVSYLGRSMLLRIHPQSRRSTRSVLERLVRF